MNVVPTLIRKHLIESRWFLALATTAYFWLSFLTCYLAFRFEREIAKQEMTGETARRFGILRVLGGESMDFSTTAIEVCWWNHPFMILPLLGWAIARGSSAVSGEIERGTVDLTLSRPVSRAAFLASQIGFAILGLTLFATALIAGSLAGSLVYTLKTPPGVLTLLPAGAMFVSLGAAIFGYTLPFSAWDVNRWRPALASVSITLAGFVAWTMAPLLERDWLRHLSVFNLYGPVMAATRRAPIGFYLVMLATIFAAGSALSFLIFERRDLPSNS